MSGDIELNRLIQDYNFEHDLREELQAQKKDLTSKLEKIAKILYEDCEELNPSNYTEEQVIALDTASCNIWGIVCDYYKG